MSNGRVTIKRTAQTVTLTLAQWQYANTATLTIGEARSLANDLLIAADKRVDVPQPSALPDIL